MTDDQSPGDHALLRELARALPNRDPVPGLVAEAARAIFTWRTVDAEIAELVDDSLLTAATGVRSSGGARMLTFEGSDLTIVVEVGEGSAPRRLVGQVLEPRRTEVELLHEHSGRPATSTARTDTYGRFVLDGVPAGLARLVCRFPDEPARQLVTGWFEL